MVIGGIAAAVLIVGGIAAASTNKGNTATASVPAAPLTVTKTAPPPAPLTTTVTRVVDGGRRRDHGHRRHCADHPDHRYRCGGDGRVRGSASRRGDGCNATLNHTVTAQTGGDGEDLDKYGRSLRYVDLDTATDAGLTPSSGKVTRRTRTTHVSATASTPARIPTSQPRGKRRTTSAPR